VLGNRPTWFFTAQAKFLPCGFLFAGRILDGSLVELALGWNMISTVCSTVQIACFIDKGWFEP
jgi:hypothetical protein